MGTAVSLTSRFDGQHGINTWVQSHADQATRQRLLFMKILKVVCFTGFGTAPSSRHPSHVFAKLTDFAKVFAVKHSPTQ
jgi:hypothetical protein